jgi:predicted secreted acid phosphatase
VPAARATTLLCCLLALAALAAAGTSGAKEPKAPATPAEIVAYYNSGEWAKDTTAQVKRAKAFVRNWLRTHPKPRPKKPAIVLDIDDTSVSLYACAKALDFEGPTSCAVETDLPAIRQVRSLYDWVRKQKVTVFFITGRPEPLRDLTVTGLRFAGYRGKLNLDLKPTTYKNDSVIPYKAGARKRIQRRGYRILANLGDQRSDLKGGYSLKTYKLPNPMYFTP